MSGQDVDPEIEGEIFEQLLEEIPTLLRVKRFALNLDRVHWFASLGDTLTPEIRRNARDYLDLLGFPEAEITPMTSFEEAADAALSMDLDTESWAQEEQLRVGLVARSLEQMDEAALNVALTHAASLAADNIREALEDIAAIWDLEEGPLLNLLTGSAVQAVHQAALVLTAAETDPHPFAYKFRLYEAGKWPIGLAGLSFNIF